MKLLPMALCLYVTLLALAPFHTASGMECWNGCSYQCWNAKMHNVENPSHFLIDTEEEKIVLTAKNSVCHISLDLNTVDNVRDVTPSADTLSACTGSPRYESPDKCHNFHHVLLLPVAPSDDMRIGDEDTPLSNTILECGSNAFIPQCNYRMRSNLTSVSDVDGSEYIPTDDGYEHTASLWLSTGRLVSATRAKTVGKFGLVMSGVPFTGHVEVGTVSAWFDKSVQFVSMYEIGDFIYTFFREVPDEPGHPVIYSRVSRVCKNDTGVMDPITAFARNYIFTTFLKARMTCVSGGGGNEIPYYYDELQDTFLVESEKEDGSLEKKLYAIFTAPMNGPAGSAVCVYSFDSGDSLESVFLGSYLRETTLGQFMEVQNNDPFSCTMGRSATDANDHHLMLDTAHQTSGDKLHLQLTGYSFKKILVAAVTDLAGNTHDVMYITSTKEGSLVLLKTLYDSIRQESLVISEQELKLSEDATTTSDEPPAVIKMQLLGNGTDAVRDAVYVGTTEALYRFPVANCGQFIGDCCACVASRDPHCAYDPAENTCLSVYSGVTGKMLLQDVANGDIAVCSAPPGSSETTPTPTGTVKTPVTVETKTEDPYSTVGAKPSPTLEPVRPSVGGVTGEEEAAQSNFQWTIIGTICAFVGGIILGILVMAFGLKNKDRFVWNKFISSSRRPTVQNQPTPPSTSNKGACNKDTEGASNFTDKAEMYERNNCDMNPHSNAAAIVVHLDPISNLPHHRHYGNGKQGTKDIEPPPYSPNKPTVLPGNGAAAIQLEMTDGEATPTTSHHSTPEHKRNRPQPHTPPADKTNKPSPTMNLPLSTPPKSSTPPSMQTTPKSSQISPTKPSTPSKATPPSQSSPLTLTPAHKHQYCRAQSHPHYYTSSHPHQTPPPNGHYSTLPPKKKRHSSTSHSETTPPKRPSSVEDPPNFSLPRPSSVQNLNHVFRARSATMATAMTTPTKQRPGMVPLSPFSAHHHQSQGGIPGSPYSNGGAAGTPVSTTSSGGSHGPSYFKFPSSPGGKLPKEAPAGTPSYYRGEGSKDLNMKATGYAVEPTSNQDRAMYGHNVATQCHTIDRKNKFQNGHTHHRGRSPPVTSGPHPHPETRLIEVAGGVVGCTDC